MVTKASPGLGGPIRGAGLAGRSDSCHPGRPQCAPDGRRSPHRLPASPSCLLAVVAPSSHRLPGAASLCDVLVSQTRAWLAAPLMRTAAGATAGAVTGSSESPRGAESREPLVALSRYFCLAVRLFLAPSALQASAAAGRTVFLASYWNSCTVNDAMLKYRVGRLRSPGIRPPPPLASAPAPPRPWVSIRAARGGAAVGAAGTALAVARWNIAC